MSPATITESQADAMSNAEIRQALARIESKLQEVKPTQTVYSRAEAIIYTKTRSCSTFSRWCQKMGVRPTKLGRYPRSSLELALLREVRTAETK